MNNKFLWLVVFCITTTALKSQSFEPVIIAINSTDTSYTVPAGYSLKIESIAYDPSAIRSINNGFDEVGVKIDGTYTLLFWRYYGSHEREIKTPFWLPEGTKLSKSNVDNFRVVFYCLLFSNTTL